MEWTEQQQLSTSRICLPSKRQVYCCPLRHATRPLARACLRHHRERIGMTGVVMVSAARPLPLSLQLRLRHSPSATTSCLVGNEGSSRYLGEGCLAEERGTQTARKENKASNDTPSPSAKRTCRLLSLVPTTAGVQSFCAACSGATSTSNTHSPGKKRNLSEGAALSRSGVNEYRLPRGPLLYTGYRLSQLALQKTIK